VPDPIAFMVMPFGRRPTGRSEPDVPAEVDFDALWLDVYRPVLEELGFRPVRADADVDALIITEMIQRLVLGDIVVADLTLPNANVYYEIGVRHAARKTGCILCSAKWAKPVFDLAQIRQVRFPLAEGGITPATANAARKQLTQELRRLADGVSPVFDSVPGYPEQPDTRRLSAFADLADELMAFDADIRAAYSAPRADRKARALEVLARHGQKPVVRGADALLLIGMLRDLVGWEAVLAFIATLPTALARHVRVMELECLAIAKAGEPIKAVGRLEALISRYGETSERLGLLGGRYKQLAIDAADEAERRRFLDLAISSYARGMMADLNDYYPASNLARLYRQRNGDGDEELAAQAQVITIAACQRALERNPADEWVLPTMLGMAFDRADVAEAARLVAEMAVKGAPPWTIESTLGDLRRSLDSHADDSVRRQLNGVLDAFKDLIPSAAGGRADDADHE
jgi:hypothetical protein